MSGDWTVGGATSGGGKLRGASNLQGSSPFGFGMPLKKHARQLLLILFALHPTPPWYFGLWGLLHELSQKHDSYALGVHADRRRAAEVSASALSPPLRAHPMDSGPMGVGAVPSPSANTSCGCGEGDGNGADEAGM